MTLSDLRAPARSGISVGCAVICTILAALPCLAQTRFRGLQPGQSKRADIVAALGQPVAELSPTVYQYKSTGDTGDIDVEYRSGSDVADRIEVHFSQPVERAALVSKLKVPEQATRSTVLNGKLIEFFGPAAFVSMTHASAEGGSGVISLGCYSQELFTRIVGPSAPPPTLHGGGSAPPAQLIQGETEFRAKLLSPLNSATSQKGDKVTAQVLAPQTFQGDTLEGSVRESKKSGKVAAKATLNFSFSTLTHAGQTVPVQAYVKSVANSKGKPDVDEEGRIIRKKNNLGKTAAGAAVGALIGGLAGGAKGAAVGAGVGLAVALVYIELATDGADLAFAPGSEFTLSVKQIQPQK